MVLIFYKVLFILSLVFGSIYVYMWHKHFDVKLSIIFTLIPVSCLGYVYMENAHNLQEAIIAKQVTYIGGCYLQFFIMLLIFSLCDIKVSKVLKLIAFTLCNLFFIASLTIGHNTFFYKKVSFKMEDGRPVLIKEYGPMHTVFYVLVIVFLLINIIAIIYSLLKKKQLSRIILNALFIPDIITVLSYFIPRVISTDIELIPLVFILSEIIFLIIAYRVTLYDVNDTVIDSMVQNGNTALLSFDFKYRYLGSNNTAKKIIPELNGLSVDSVLYENSKFAHRILHWLNSFKNNKNDEFVFTVKADTINEDEDRIYNVKVDYLFDGRRNRGYIITMMDHTKEQKYISLLDEHNEMLSQQVEEKNKHIAHMAAEQKKIETELSLASNIQNSSLPNTFPAYPDRDEFDIYATMTPARQIGGDFYDYFLIDDDHLCIVIADVSGKGIPAALFMMTAKITIKNCASEGLSPKSILEHTNNELCSNNQMEMFVTVWMGILELSTGLLTASNAGHEYPFFRKNGVYEVYKDPHSIVVGCMEDTKYSEYQVNLNPGDGIFLYTDGLAEARNEKNEMYGLDRVTASLNLTPKASAKQTIEDAGKEVANYVKDTPQFDDLTMLCITYK